MLGNVAHPQAGVSMGGAGAGTLMPSWLDLWNEWEIQTVVVASFSLQVILFFLAGIRRYSVSFVLKVLLWLVYLLADVVATYALGHMSSSLSKKSSSENQLVAFWAPFLVLHLGGQDTITAYALEDNKLWLRHLLNLVLQVAATAYVLYKYIIAGGATFVRAAMLVLAAGVVKYGERIWALKLASKGGPPRPRTRPFLLAIYDDFRGSPRRRWERQKQQEQEEWHRQNGRDCFTKNKQFRAYAFIVTAAHALRHVLVKPLIIDRNEASIDWNSRTTGLVKGLVRGFPWQDDESEDASATEKRTIGELYKGVEVQLALMYDMLYTKAEVIHTRYGHFIRAISLVSCFAALVVFTKSKRDGYSTPDIVITFALLGGACALEVASCFKAIGSTWTYDILRRHRLHWLANAILFARYHLVVVKDGRWSSSVGQFDLISFYVHSSKRGLKGRLAKMIGVKDLWDKASCTKHAKLSPALKQLVFDLLKGDKRHMVHIEEVDTRSGIWARRFSGFAQSDQKLDWSLSFEFQKSVLIWHIATDTFLNHPAVKSELADKAKDKEMGEAVNTLSDYMMYLLVEHPDILPIKAAARNLFDETCNSYSNAIELYYMDWFRENKDKDVPNKDVISHQTIMEYKGSYWISEEIKTLYGDWTHPFWDEHPGEAVLVKACTLAHTMLNMELELTYKMAIIGTVWKEMLCYAASNATGDFHARQLSNGGEFLTHILLLTQYAAAMPEIEEPSEVDDESVEASAATDAELDVENGWKDEITESC